MLRFFGAMSRLAIHCLPIILFVIGAWSATPAAAGPGMHRKVYLLRGLTNVFSPGLDQLADELRKSNIEATVTNHAFWESLATEATRELHCSGRPFAWRRRGREHGRAVAARRPPRRFDCYA